MAFSLLKRVKPTDDSWTAKAPTSKMDALQHPVPILRHLPPVVLPDFRPQVPPASPLHTSGPALLPDVAPAPLLHLDHRFDPAQPPRPPVDARHLLLLPPAEYHLVLSSKKYWHLPSHRSSSRLLLSFSFRFVFGVTHEQQLLINSARLTDSFPEFAILLTLVEILLLASEFGSDDVTAQESCSWLVSYPDSPTHVVHPPVILSSDYIQQLLFS